MSNNPSDMGGLSPVGGLTPVGGGSPVSPPPATPKMETLGAAPVATPTTRPMPPVPTTRSSRFDPLAPPPPPTPRMESPAPVATTAPNSNGPKLASEPTKDRAYSMAAAYRRGEVEPMGSGRMVAGILAGMGAGGIATFLWILLYLSLHIYQTLWLGGAMGFIVGWSVFKATNEGEETSCWIACIISFIYAASGVAFINYAYYTAVGIPNIISLVFGIFAVGLAAERGFRTPEVLAVETSV